MAWITYDADKEMLTMGLVGVGIFGGLLPIYGDELGEGALNSKFLIHEKVSDKGGYVGSNAFGVKKVVKKQRKEYLVLLCTNVREEMLAFSQKEINDNEKQAREYLEFSQKHSLHDSVIKDEERLNKVLDKKNKLLIIHVRMNAETVKNIISKGVCRLHITTELYKNQKNYVLRKFNYMNPTINSPVEVNEDSRIFTARLNKAEIVNRENNQKYTEFDLNVLVPKTPEKENQNAISFEKANIEKPKLGVDYLPTSVVLSSISAKSNSFRARPEVAKLIASINSLGGIKGAVIITLPYSGIGYRQGLRPDDIVLYVDDKEVQGITTGLGDSLSNVKNGDKIILTIWRESHEMKIPIQF